MRQIVDESQICHRTVQGVLEISSSLWLSPSIVLHIYTMIFDVF
jgi:hypothetical protein